MRPACVANVRLDGTFHIINKLPCKLEAHVDILKVKAAKAAQEAIKGGQLYLTALTLTVRTVMLHLVRWVMRSKAEHNLSI